MDQQPHGGSTSASSADTKSSWSAGEGVMSRPKCACSARRPWCSRAASLFESITRLAGFRQRCCSKPRSTRMAITVLESRLVPAALTFEDWENVGVVGHAVSVTIGQTGFEETVSGSIDWGDDSEDTEFESWFDE